MSDHAKLVVFKFQTASHINVVRQQRQSDLGFHTRVVVFDQGIVAKNVDHSTVQFASYENRPR